MLYNPPLVDRVQGIRRSVVLESQRIATRLLKAGVKTIVFARSRVRTELIATYIRDSLKNFYTDNHGITVQSYRGGYLPNERRAIEKGLRDGSIQGVVSTNALELGIDIGGLDASILSGFPGTISSSWQQAGRAGRRNTVSLSILVASSSPTDQFVIQHPEYFFSRSPENGYIDPGNVFIQTDQLKCALFELPFEEGETFGEDTPALLESLTEKGVIRHAGAKWYWADRSYPAENVSLRTSTAENVVIVDTTRGRDEVIGEMDLPSAKLLVFDHAIYIHLGDQFAVKQLDLENRRCFVEAADTDYWTDSIVKTDIKVLTEDEEKHCRGHPHRAGGPPCADPGNEVQEAEVPHERERRLRGHHASRGRDAHAVRRAPVRRRHRPGEALRRAARGGAGDRDPADGGPPAHGGPGIPALRSRATWACRNG